MKVKVLWLFPPMGEGFPNISQYRFYKRMPIRASIIYPYLAASGVTQIRNAGHDVKLLDCPTQELQWGDVACELKDADLVILEARTPILEEIWKAISIIKTLSRGKIAVYGDHVSWDYMSALFKGADFVLRGGDYDYAAAQLCDDLMRDRAHYRMIRFRVHDLDALPVVDRELVNWRDYFESWRTREHFFWNMSQRGCPYRCIFCAWAETFWDNEIRSRSPHLVAAEYADLFERYGKLEILDDADLFQFRWGYKLAEQLLKRGFDDEEILWSCQSHPAQVLSVTADQLATMKKAGFHVVKLGIESSHTLSLRKMKKGSSMEICEKAINRLKDADVMVHANMMIGFPWETKQDALESLSWLKKLDPNQAQFSLLIPYPNTELWRMAEDNDWFIQDKMNWSLYDASFPMLKMEGLSGEEIVDLYRQLWSGFYLNWRYIWKHLSKVRHWSGVKHLFTGFRSIYFGHMKAVDRRKKS